MDPHYLVQTLKCTQMLTIFRLPVWYGTLNGVKSSRRTESTATNLATTKKNNPMHRSSTKSTASIFVLSCTDFLSPWRIFSSGNKASRLTHDKFIKVAKPWCFFINSNLSTNKPFTRTSFSVFVAISLHSIALRQQSYPRRGSSSHRATHWFNLPPQDLSLNGDASLHDSALQRQTFGDVLHLCAAVLCAREPHLSVAFRTIRQSALSLPVIVSPLLRPHPSSDPSSYAAKQRRWSSVHWPIQAWVTFSRRPQSSILNWQIQELF